MMIVSNKQTTKPRTQTRCFLYFSFIYFQMPAEYSVTDTTILINVYRQTIQSTI